MPTFFDAHAHLPPGDDALPRLLALMDELAIERAIVVAGGVVTPQRLSELMRGGGGCDVDPPNARVLAAARASHGRLVPFYFANPHRPDGYAREGMDFRGLKLGPVIHGVPFTDRRVDALIETAAALGHAVYAHCLARPGLTVAAYAELAARHRAVTFVLGHAGIGQCDFDAVTTIEAHPNVMFEMSGGFSSVCAFAVRTLGAERVLFGSEYPLQHPRVELEKLRVLDLSTSEFALVGRENARRLIGARA